MATATVKGSFLAAARQFTENLYHCSRCNYCVEASWEEKGLRHVCPTLLHHSPALSYSGKGYLATARALADGEELSAATVADRVFACTTCGNCEEACPIGLQPAQLVKAMRADLVDHGLAPDSALELASNIASTGNPDGLPAAERYAWASELQTDSGSAPEFLYLPGLRRLLRQTRRSARHGGSADRRRGARRDARRQSRSMLRRAAVRNRPARRGPPAGNRAARSDPRHGPVGSAEPRARNVSRAFVTTIRNICKRTKRLPRGIRWRCSPIELQPIA